jgi:hypothetical protein
MTLPGPLSAQAGAATQPYRLENMVATLMHTMFDFGKLRLDAGLPREFSQFVQNGEPIGELF